MNVLIESGATKSEWHVGGSGESFFLHGMNVSSMPMKSIKSILEQGLTKIDGISGADGIFLYTAGVVTQSIREELSGFIRDFAPCAEIDVQDDLVGACRAAWGHGSGLVAIMGTGSNTGFFDGEKVIQNVYSGGFIIGDQGSASVLGRHFLEDWIKFKVPEDVAADFKAEFDSSYEAIIDKLYNGDAPSRYLGSIAPFVTSHYESSQYARDLVDNNFREFAKRSLLAYDVADYPVAVIGGFGWACRDIVTGIFGEYGIRIERFMPAPIEGLIRYHKL